MAKEEIVEGIKVALDKGQNLRDAMMSFFNAGYPREDINDAAREVLNMRDSAGNRIYSNEGKISNFRNVQPIGQVPPAPATQPSVPRPPQNTNNQFQQPAPAQFRQNQPTQQSSNQFQQQFQQNQPPFGQAYPQQMNFQQNQFNQQRSFPQQQFQQNPSQLGQAYPQQMNFQQNQFNQQRSQNQFANQNAGNINTPNSVVPTPPTTPQKVSEYSGEKKKSSGKWVLFFFLFLFLILITGGIVGLVMFKDQIFNFFGI